MDIGCVRMTERHLRDDPPTPDQVAAAEADIDAAVDRCAATVTGDAGPHPGRARRVGDHGDRARAAAWTAYRPERIHHARVAGREVAAVTAEPARA